MRKLLFRGFNAKNKKWIYGFYIQNRGEHFIAPDEFATGKSWEDYKVLPETVGQHTGMKDKNDKEIWEGDIVKADDDFVSEVYFNEYMAMFQIEDMRTDRAFTLYEWDLEVIGNIHDNPELLKD